VAEELADHFETPENITATEVPKYTQPVSGYQGLRKCDRVGNSGILIKRHVIETVPLGTFRYDLTEDRLDINATEDYVWCDAIRAHGFEIFVDCGLKLEHFKKVNLYTVKQLMVGERLAGQADMIRAIEKMKASGATHEQTIEGILAWYKERFSEVYEVEA